MVSDRKKGVFDVFRALGFPNVLISAIGALRSVRPAGLRLGSLKRIKDTGVFLEF